MDTSDFEPADESPHTLDSGPGVKIPEALLRSIDLSGFANAMAEVTVPKFDLSGLANAMAAVTVPKFDLSGLANAVAEVTVPKFDMSGFAAQLPRIDPRVFDPLIRVLENLQSAFSFDFQRFADQVGRAFYPANLRGIDGLEFESLFSVLEDGIPLYEVPREATAIRLINAPDLPSRRKIIGERFDAIVDDCDAALSSCTNTDYLYEVSAVREAIAVIRDGHKDAGQALAATVMDSLLWRWGYRNNDDWKLVTRKLRGKNSPPRDIRDLMAYTSMAMLPVYVAHATFRPNGGDPIPHVFNRHATLHRISYRQYSKRNCAVSLMLATSVLAYMCTFH